jgi:hypothetical protein
MLHFNEWRVRHSFDEKTTFQAESLQAPQASESQAIELTFLISIVNCKLWTVSSPGGRQLTVDS